jgi:hypothetical protein
MSTEEFRSGGIFGKLGGISVAVYCRVSVSCDPRRLSTVAYTPGKGLYIIPVQQGGERSVFRNENILTIKIRMGEYEALAIFFRRPNRAWYVFKHHPQETEYPDSEWIRWSFTCAKQYLEIQSRHLSDETP